MTPIPYKQLLAESPHFFAKDMFGLRMSPCHQKMMDHVSGDKRASLLLCQRGLGKSLILQAYITWYVIHNPNHRVILVSDTDTKARSFMRAIKNTLESETIKSIYGEMKGNVWTDHELNMVTRTEIHAEPTLQCLGAGSGACTGRHCELLVIDDLVSFDSTRGQIRRDRTRDWYLTSLLPTLITGGRIIAAGTRYHFADIYDLLINRLNYNVLILPPIKENGEPQCSWLQPLDDVIDDKGNMIQRGLTTIKRDLGSVIYSLQYENDVRLLLEGNIIKLEWIQYCDQIPQLESIIITCDPAISKRDSADFTAIIVGGRSDEGNVYIKEYINEHLSFNETIETLIRLAGKYKIEEIRIEQVGFSEAFITELKRKISGILTRGIRPLGDKASRLQEVSPLMENMLVYFMRNQTQIVDQMLLFPEGDHDDLVDAMGLFLSYYKIEPDGIILW